MSPSLDTHGVPTHRTTRLWTSLLLGAALVASACSSSDEAATDGAFFGDTVADSDDPGGLEPDDGSFFAEDAEGSANDLVEEEPATSEQLDAESDLAESERAVEVDEMAEASSSSHRAAVGATALGDGDAEAGLIASAPRQSAMSEEPAADWSASAQHNGGLFPEESQIEPPRRDAPFRTFIDADVDPLSTFALDVDTGSYSLARDAIENGRMPDRERVRPEEFLNAFDYGYADPNDELGIFIDGGPSPFDDDNLLVRVGVQAERVDPAERPDANLTFLVDTSGSMNVPNRIGLVKESLTTLVGQLRPSDTVALVTYGSDARVILDATPIRKSDEILGAIQDLATDGSTNLDAGLTAAYHLARVTREMGNQDEINRVILASDGIANVGLTDPTGLAQMIRDDADAGIQLLTLGVGTNGFNDTLMEQLADQGDGIYAYLDTTREAETFFSTDLVGTLWTLAVDAKIQVEFDPDTVGSYRLIGFENRAVADHDFRNDEVDAGEIGAGHTVTALYEITPTRRSGDLGRVNLRWERPDDGSVVEIDRAIDDAWISDRFGSTDPGFQLATTIAVWAELLRGNPYADGTSLDQVAAEAVRLHDDIGSDETAELVELTRWTANRG